MAPPAAFASQLARRLAVAITLLGLLWLSAILAAPLSAGHGEAAWPALVYQAGGLVCHQRPERSFSLGGVQLPVCARCLGLYVSGTAGALLAWLLWRGRLAQRVLRRPRLPLALAALPTALTVAGEWAGLTQPGNVGRALAALPLGLLGGWLFVALLRAESAWRPPQMRYHS